MIIPDILFSSLSMEKNKEKLLVKFIFFLRKVALKKT